MRLANSTLESKRRFHRSLVERLEGRTCCASDFCNGFNALDVNDDGYVSPLDALIVVNDLNTFGSLDVATLPRQHRHFIDVDDDGQLAAKDVLLVVNHLNIRRQGAETTLPLVAYLTPDSDPNGNGVVLRPNVTLQGQAPAEARVRLKVDDRVLSVASVAGDGTFELSVNLSAGTQQLRVELADEQGNTNWLEMTVKLGDTVLDWNAAALNVIRDWTTFSNDPYSNRIVTERPPVAARNLAMVHLAMFDAINAVTQSFTPYLNGPAAPTETSQAVAAAVAAHRVARSLYSAPPELAAWDASLVETLQGVTDGAAKSNGVMIGEQVAARMLRDRAGDGATSVRSYLPSGEAGHWNRTFPDYLPPLLTQWPNVAPFAMNSGSQFRPEPPPALDSLEYAEAVDEVMELGGYISPLRTAEQTEIALFWADGGGTFTPPGHWNQIAAEIAVGRGHSLEANARIFALLNMALADAGIAAWDAKYAYDLWRPIDAIRRAGTDGNTMTTAAADWIPLLKTPPFPTYTSGHSTFSGAAAEVLTVLLGDRVPFESAADSHSGFRQRPLAASSVSVRSFDSFWAAAEEAGRSRIYGGIHFEFDNRAGLDAGKSIGQFVVANFLKPT